MRPERCPGPSNAQGSTVDARRSSPMSSTPPSAPSHGSPMVHGRTPRSSSERREQVHERPAPGHRRDSPQWRARMAPPRRDASRIRSKRCGRRRRPFPSVSDKRLPRRTTHSMHWRRACPNSPSRPNPRPRCRPRSARIDLGGCRQRTDRRRSYPIRCSASTPGHPRRRRAAEHRLARCRLAPGAETIDTRTDDHVHLTLTPSRTWPAVAQGPARGPRRQLSLTTWPVS